MSEDEHTEAKVVLAQAMTVPASTGHSPLTPPPSLPPAAPSQTRASTRQNSCSPATATSPCRRFGALSLCSAKGLTKVTEPRRITQIGSAKSFSAERPLLGWATVSPRAVLVSA
eukprot:3635107-Prymnesium_polylepis.1